MRAVLAFALLAACNTHDPNRVEIVKENCMPCHTAAKGQLSHPEDMFPIATGPHAVDNAGEPVLCQECHDFVHDSTNAGMAGVNVNCLTCHSQADMEPLHVGVAAYAWEPAPKDFCLTCHPNGQM